MGKFLIGKVNTMLKVFNIFNPIKFILYIINKGYQLSWLERTPDKGEGPGSNPGWPTWGYSSVGRALPLQGKCQQFESAYLHLIFHLVEVTL